MWERTTSCPERAPGAGTAFGWVQNWGEHTAVCTQRAWNYSCLARPSHNLGKIAWTRRWGPGYPSQGSHCKMKDACEAWAEFMCSSIVRNSLRIPFTVVSGLWGTAWRYQVLLTAGVLNMYFSLEGVCSPVPLRVSVLKPSHGTQAGAPTAAGAKTPVLVPSPPHCIRQPPWARQGYRLADCYSLPYHWLKTGESASVYRVL